MTDRELIDLVERMRALQVSYFRTRDPLTLDHCRIVERQVDREIASRKDKQKQLF